MKPLRGLIAFNWHQIFTLDSAVVKNKTKKTSLYISSGLPDLHSLNIQNMKINGGSDQFLDLKSPCVAAHSV